MSSYEVKASPAARKLAKELGIELSDLTSTSSPAKIIQINDVLNARKAASAEPQQEANRLPSRPIAPRQNAVSSEISHTLTNPITAPVQKIRMPEKQIADDDAPDNLFDYNYVKDKPAFENMLDAVERKSRASAAYVASDSFDLFLFDDFTKSPEMLDVEKEYIVDQLTKNLGVENDLNILYEESEQSTEEGIEDLTLAEDDSFLYQEEPSEPEKLEEDTNIIEFSSYYATPETPTQQAPPEEAVTQPPYAYGEAMFYSRENAIAPQEAQSTYLAQQPRTSNISAKARIDDQAIIELLAKLKIGYRLGIINTVVKAVSFALEKQNIQLCERIAVINTQSAFECYIVEHAKSSPIQSITYTEFTDTSSTAGILATVWDLTATGIDSFSATSLEGIQFYVTHSDEALHIAMETTDSIIEAYQAIRLMETLKEVLQKPARFL
ncbi:MAG: E3 binding domain-containing protein [Eubacteriaceae bacterium]|nr:E3 binding domain-containing protein [Eubacteriaceae bacterium]